MDEFEVFIENNTKTLKYLEVFCAFNGNEDDMNKKSSQRFLKIIKKSVNLVHFSTSLGMFDKYLTQDWAQIANNCKQLKSLKVCLEFNRSLQLNNEILSTLRGLKRLEVLLIDRSRPRNDIIKDLSVYHELTHLSIKSLYYCLTPFEESMLSEIDINFPKLKSLTIYCPFIASQRTAQILTGLSSLETIDLDVENEEIIPEIKRQLIQNCKKFKSFKTIQL